MCQGLPLEIVYNACWFVRCWTETLAVVRDFTFLSGTSNGSDYFCTVLLYKLFMFPNFCRFVRVPKVW